MRRVLLDENLPRPMAKFFQPPLEVISVHDMGWAEMKNGELINAMQQAGFEFLLTADRNLQYQQNLSNTPIRLVVLLTFNNRLKNLLPHVSEIQATILKANDAEQVIEIDLRDSKT
jgi:predicted nuclease of predicted toxin-antitoxin system